MARCDVHATRAGVHRDEVGGENTRCSRQEWMLRGQALQFAARKRTGRFTGRFETCRGAKCFYARGSKNERFRHALLSESMLYITLLRMQCDREVRRQGPGSR